MIYTDEAPAKPATKKPAPAAKQPVESSSGEEESTEEEDDEEEKATPKVTNTQPNGAKPQQNGTQVNIYLFIANASWKYFVMKAYQNTVYFNTVTSQGFVWLISALKTLS